ncbi:3-deoxy-7-phosphoheptulonate synthase [Lactiplantibacillus plantarum]|uniref:3-deoxy-7-phosphoheptulonate synthase n=1 Tax=Lactiplantibacillus plantarum TaxID=1590 RepID=UPI00112B3AE1|nr:3-deoxy-7-phosphoheptulonate synthase [Lactiplantibacillus plantarum]TPV65824.1 3-deoxy-7-phosphoheptulonate synthase [Lactiplantibacillus plantarum]WCJ50483.1 3-deoxy-7-phosphoheptulonate synthase [Lactiplantibacillus plantarum]
MIIILKPATATAMQAKLVSQFGADHEIFTHNNRIAIQGLRPEALPAAVQSSRLFHPEDTIIKTLHSVIGGNQFVMMAGPCSVESAEHVDQMAAVAKQGGATIVRGGAFKPRTSPYSFQGLGETGLQYLRTAADKHGLDMITEVMDDEHVAMVAKYTDIFQIGARNMQNFSLLKAVGQTQIPVALKRGMSATIDDVLNAAEYIAAGGNHQIMLLERGIRTFDNKYTRNTFDLGAVPVLQSLTHYPVIVDPSHAVGTWELVTPMAMAGVAAGASGMIVEIHDQPTQALSDGPQALKPATYLKMAQQAFQLHDLMQTWA